MKQLTKSLALVFVMAGALAAQAADKIYAVVDYMHIPVGRSEEDYIGLEKLWQRLHQKAVDSGDCIAWYLDRVENGGRNQFVTIRVYDSLDKYTKGWPDSMWKGLFTPEENGKMQKTGQARTLTHREIWELEASAMKSGDEDPLEKTEVDFIKPTRGNADQYYDMETNYYQKIHKARIDAGAMKSWFFMTRVAPSGADGEFDFITLNTFPNKGGGWDSKIAQSALTKEEWEKLPNASDLRTIVRQEVWHPLLRTTPKK